MRPLRILYVFHSFGAWGSSDHIWDRNIRDSLIFQGHELVFPHFDQNKAHDECTHDASGETRARYSQLMVDSVKSHLSHGNLSLIFTYFDNRNILPEALDEIRAFGVPTVNFFCNAAHEFHKVDQVAAHFDFCIVPERSALQSYREIGARPLHIQMAANPRFYRPLDLPEIFDVSFIGTKYLNREQHLIRLSQAGLNVHTYGTLWEHRRQTLRNASLIHYPRIISSVLTWPIRMWVRQIQGKQLPCSHYHGPVSDEKMVQIFNQSKIVLGLSDVIDPSGKILRHIRLRDFEGPMCGTFYLTGFQEELGEYYEIGKEIECYNTLEELTEKATFYCRHDASREIIALAGLR